MLLYLYYKYNMSLIRKLNISKYLATKDSFFLFGARGVGKTSLIRTALSEFRPYTEINLLQAKEYRTFIENPSRLADIVEGKLKLLPKQEILRVFLDEVQKVPALLDEVHNLISLYEGKVQFILTGSSARKLKRQGANLLAGRAAVLHLHPLTSDEIALDLTRALHIGLLPGIYLKQYVPTSLLNAYVNTYLKEEIQQEALTRKVDSFARFLSVAGQMSGEPTNFTYVAKDCGVSPASAKEYFSILCDTLVAYRIDGWSPSIRKQLIQSPKFYIFDTGTLNSIRNELGDPPTSGSSRFGDLFEHYVLGEIVRCVAYEELGYDINYWRTNTGTEVDFILSKNGEPLVAIEVKSSERLNEGDTRALKEFAIEYPSCKLAIVSREIEELMLNGVHRIPWHKIGGTLRTAIKA